MTRPIITPADLQSGMEAWDAVLRDMITAMISAPFPVAEYADVPSLPAAGSHDRCLAATISPEDLYFSKGGAWVKVTP